MKHFTFFGIVLLLMLAEFIVCHNHTSFNDQLTKKVDNFVENLYMPFSRIKGLGLAIQMEDYSYSRGYGFADENGSILTSNNHQFFVGSISKTFTALAAVKVLSQSFPDLGETVLDTPIAKLLPSADFVLTDQYRTQHATFRDLLSHRLCASAEDLPLLADVFDTEEIVYRQRFAEEVCGFRSQFTYNNQAVLLASKLIGLLANTTFASYARSLLDEMGMYNSGFIISDDTWVSLTLAKPYYTRQGKTYPMNSELLKRASNMKGAAGLYMSINDMTKFMEFFANSGNVAGRQIVKKEAMNWMKIPSVVLHGAKYKSGSGQADENDILFSDNYYGLGLHMGLYNGFEMYSHSGYFPPYESLWSYFPALNLGIFSSSNYAPVHVDQKLLHAFIFESLKSSRVNAEGNFAKAMKKDAKKWLETNQKKEKDIEEIFGLHEINKNQIKSEHIVGKYGSRKIGVAEISQRWNPQTNQTGLYLKYGKWAHGWLHSSPTSAAYQIEWNTDFVQDQYAKGHEDGFGIAVIENKVLEIYFVQGTGSQFSVGKFTRNAFLDDLPEIPWVLNSCVMDQN